MAIIEKNCIFIPLNWKELAGDLWNDSRCCSFTRTESTSRDLR